MRVAANSSTTPGWVKRPDIQQDEQDLLHMWKCRPLRTGMPTERPVESCGQSVKNRTNPHGNVSQRVGDVRMLRPG